MLFAFGSCKGAPKTNNKKPLPPPPRSFSCRTNTKRTWKEKNKSRGTPLGWKSFVFVVCFRLGSGLLLLASPQGIEAHVGHLDDLEADSRNISDGVTLTTESGNENFVLEWRDEVREELLKKKTNNSSGEREGLTFSSMKLRQPSRGTKAAIFLPFLMSCTRTHLRMAELGCLASIPLNQAQKKRSEGVRRGTKKREAKEKIRTTSPTRCPWRERLLRRG